MKKLLLGLLFTGGVMSAQVVVNGIDINSDTNVNSIEVYTVAKPFNTKESIFVNDGINDFKIHNYDTKKQSIFNAEGKKFEKGEYLNLYNYLLAQGWEEGSTRTAKIGDQTGNVVIFKKKKV